MESVVHANTIVATTCDELTITPPAILSVNGKATSGNIGDLGLTPNIYDASLNGQDVKLILVEPDRVVLRAPTSLRPRLPSGHLGFDTAASHAAPSPLSESQKKEAESI